MRHNKTINHLGRKSAHRQAMLSNLAASLIMHKRVSTTLAKAKALRTYIEPLITRAKEDSTHQRRVVFSYLQSKEAVTELFREVSQKVADRPGGYTRILKTGNRQGDNAEMCIIELVDYNETMLGTKETKTKTSRRRRGSGTTKKTETDAPKAEKTTKKTKAAEAKAEKVEEVKDETVEPAADQTDETTPAEEDDKKE